MQTSGEKFPVLRYSLSGFAALRDSLLYIPVWIVVFFAISLVCTVFFNMVSVYHAGQIVINIKHYLQFDFSNFSDANSLDYIFQLKDIFELALPIALAYCTVIPIAVERSRLSEKGASFAHIGFGQSELIVALNTLISFIPPLAFYILFSVVGHKVADLVAPVSQVAAATPGFDQPAITPSQVTGHNIHLAFRAISMIVSVPLVIYTYVKTLLALPYSVDQSRLGVLYSWRATRPMFWNLFQVEAWSVVWAVLSCAAVYALFVAGYKFLFAKVYFISYSVTFNGVMDASYFFNLLAISIIYTLFLILTLAPAARVYRAIRADGEDAEAI